MVGIVVTNGSRRTANVVVKSINNVLVPKSTTPVTLTGQISPSTRLDQLTDVVEGTPANNQTLVYNSQSDTYVVDYLDLDGGTF